MFAMVRSVDPIINQARKAVGVRAGLSGYDALIRSDQIAMDLFAGFNEISHSYDTLLDIEVYISRFPYANTRITRSGHLRFIIEAYLHESYTLCERLKSYSKLISRRLAGHLPKIDYKGTCKRAGELAAAGLKNVVIIRGEHVHQRRFSTADLDRADLYDLLRTHMGDGQTRMFGEYTYREARKKWLATIRTNNRDLARLLDLYFLLLHPLVFDPTGEAFLK
jgi:hypothetical protein